MAIKYKNFLIAISLPLTILTMSLLYHILWTILGWPKGDELILIIKNFFKEYGLWMVFFSSILESAVILGNYFPGGVVIFFSVASSKGDPLLAILTVFIVSIGFFIGYFIDYILGKYGWYKLIIKLGGESQIEKAKQKISTHSFKAIFNSYWEINLASITATACGILQINLKQFLKESTISLVFWNMAWGLLVYFLGDNALKIITSTKYALPIVVIWILILTIFYFKPKIVSK
jgi:membrane protein DedA with SNARE-associated domain